MMNKELWNKIQEMNKEEKLLFLTSKAEKEQKTLLEFLKDKDIPFYTPEQLFEEYIDQSDYKDYEILGFYFTPLEILKSSKQGYKISFSSFVNDIENCTTYIYDINIKIDKENYVYSEKIDDLLEEIFLAEEKK